MSKKVYEVALLAATLEEMEDALESYPPEKVLRVEKDEVAIITITPWNFGELGIGNYALAIVGFKSLSTKMKRQMVDYLARRNVEILFVHDEVRSEYIKGSK